MMRKKLIIIPTTLGIVVGLAIWLTLLFVGSAPTVSAAIETLRPNAVGDYEDWLISDSTDYGATSDQGDGTYIYTLTKDDIDLMSIADHSVGSGTINSVTVWMRVQIFNGGGGAEQGNIYIKTNANYYDGDTHNFTDEPSWGDFSEVWTDNPQSLSAWTWDEVDALQAGVKTTKHDGDEEMRCAEVWIVVDYTPTPSYIPRGVGVGNPIIY